MAPAHCTRDSVLKGVGVGIGVSYAVLCACTGTTRLRLNGWYAATWLSQYFRGFARANTGVGAAGLWRAAVDRGSTLRRVLKLEVDHQLKIIEAGGPAAVAEDPTRLWRLGLLHVRTARQAKQAAQKAGSGGGGMGADAGPVLKDLVLVGGGHSHVHVLLMLGMEPIPGVRVTLVTRDMETPYSGMLPGHVAGHYTRRECHIDLARIGRFAKARVVHAEVTGIDVLQQRVHLRSCLDEQDGAAERPSLRYDVISVDIGCSPSTLGGVSGYDAVRGGSMSHHVATVKPIDGFSARFDRLLEDVPAWEGPKDIVVVGAGAGGVELALAVQHRLQETLRKLGKPAAWVQLAIVSRSPELMPNHAAAVRNIFEEVFAERGVRVYKAHAAVRIEARRGGRGEALMCSTPAGEVAIDFDECIWCTDGASQGWARELGIETDDAGFLSVEPTLQARQGGQVLENFFAAGDCCSIRGYPRPKAGVFAVMAGMPLSKNLRAVLEGGPLVPYLPQKEFLGIIGLGSGGAVASKADVAMREPWLWDLKDWIDRTWMWKYTDGLPKMGGGEDPASKNAVARHAGGEALELLRKASMRCGGCGSKVGSTVLSDAVGRLQAEAAPGIYANEEVIVGVGSPDDAAVVRQRGAKQVTVQTVDFFKSLVGDPYVFGRLAALHALSDCFAMGARAQTALALVTVQLGADEVMTEDLFQMMAGANRELSAARCTLAGGHTTEGPEAALGFCITGVADSEAQLMKKGGMAPGDVVLLTKPVGTGCLFAAEMQQQARGQHVSAALRYMLLSNEPAAHVARDLGASSCTDVTGFGLVGHLVEMCRASEDCSVRLTLERVPVLPGAPEAVEAGIMSSLQPANFRLRRALRNEPQVAAAFAAGHIPRYPLIFDPQTNGGLLLSLRPKHVEAFHSGMAKLGQQCWQIGEVCQRPSGDWHAGQYIDLVMPAPAATA